MAAPALTQSVQGVGVVPADLLNTFAQTCDNVGQLREFIGLTRIEVLVRGLVAPGDGGGGTFYWMSKISAADDGVNYIVPLGASGGGWVRNLLSGAFGVRGNIVAAATTDIGSLGTNNIYVTGTTQITSFGTTAKVVNPVFLLTFAAALTIKNSAKLICPGGNDITTAANSLYLVQALGAGTFVITPLNVSSGGGGSSYPGFGSQTSLASAATTDLGTIATHNVLVTGTTSITSFGSSASAAAPVYLVQFQGALTLTYDATAMILVGGGNITTAAGDVAFMQYLGSGNWQMLTYQRAAGTGLNTSASFQSVVISASGSFTIPASATTSTVFKFTTVGGGGGGGYGASSLSAAGGGSGAYCIAWLSGFTAGNPVTISIGAGGSGGTSGSVNGITGGGTTVTYNSVAVITSNGGSGGAGGSGNGGFAGAASVSVGASGLTLNSSILYGAQEGSPPTTFGSIHLGGTGGVNPIGLGGPSGSAPGSNGISGGGGAGGQNATNGGAGGSGIVLVEWIG